MRAKLEEMYDDLYGTPGKKEKENRENGNEIDLDRVNQTISDIFGSPKEEAAGRSPDAIEPSAPTEATATDQEAEDQAQPAEAEEETDPMEELDALIGLQAIKHDVKELIAYVKVQKLREESGLKSVPASLHLVFTGNPGTGKTTVARIIAKLYKQIGVLSSGQLVEVDRSGLVAGYVGQTALKTQQKIEEAMGGILFIDEAYALAKEGNDFGQEAVDTVLKAMEDNRSDFVVIVAGYTEPMERFIESNPGLKSRFNKYIEFADYTMEELTAIFPCDVFSYQISAQVHISAPLCIRYDEKLSACSTPSLVAFVKGNSVSLYGKYSAQIQRNPPFVVMRSCKCIV